jgi:4'-phosphopantetheinyl transferase
VRSAPLAWLYFARTDALADDPMALAWLDDEERARHARFVFEHSKREFRAAHALVRGVLSRHRPEVLPQEWRFARNAHGCPSIHDDHRPDGWRFNLSHTDGMLCVLVACGRELGVDVEDAQRARATVTVADRFFSPAEVSALRALPETARIPQFFAYWTLKESYIKARGMGLALPLDGFSFAIEPGEDDGRTGWLADRVTLACEPDVQDDGARWSFARVRLSERHVGAIALARDGLGGTLALHDAKSVTARLEITALRTLREG